MKNLRIGTDHNIIEILSSSVEIKPFAQMVGGIINDAIYLKITGYHLDDVLCQMIDEYGEDNLIKRIKAL